MSGFQKAIKKEHQRRKKVANDIAMLLERQGKLNAPVKTGHLKRSTNSDVQHQETKSEIFFGTNGVEYSAIVNEGSSVKNIKPQPYIKDSITQSLGEIKNIIKEGMSTGK